MILIRECFPAVTERGHSDVTDEVVSCLMPTGICNGEKALLYECCSLFPLLCSLRSIFALFVQFLLIYHVRIVLPLQTLPQDSVDD